MPGTPIGPGTRFDLASLTKPIATTTLLAQAVAAGHIDLSAPLQHYLADARGTPCGQFRVRDLLCHTSGWPAWLDYFAATTGFASHQRLAEVRHLVLTTQPVAETGVQAVYSDLGFMALGWMLEATAGQPLSDLFARQIAKPLNIHVGYRPMAAVQPLEPLVATEIWSPRCSDGLPLQGVVHDDNCAALGGVAGHAGLFGAAHDVAVWAQQWLSAHAGDPVSLGLDPSLVRAWTAAAGVAGSNWRHGWDSPTQPGSTAGSLAPADSFGHLGFTGTSVWLAPSADVAAVLLTNRVHPDRSATGPIKTFRLEMYDLLWTAVAHPPVR